MITVEESKSTKHTKKKYKYLVVITEKKSWNKFREVVWFFWGVGGFLEGKDREMTRNIPDICVLNVYASMSRFGEKAQELLLGNVLG